MKIGVLSVGNVDAAVLTWIMENLAQAFPDTSCLVIDENLPLREQAFDEKRMQYRSHAILHEIKSSTFKNACVNRVLGIVDADIFVPELNFVFGEAACPGRVALISLWRLKPEFYGHVSNMRLFLERTLKEAVHEIGHTLGLMHCLRSSCVMYFSKSISDTDLKPSLFCGNCYLHAKLSLKEIG